MPDDSNDTQSNFGLKGPWGDFIKLGFAGIVAGAFLYLLTVSIPHQQKCYLDEMRIEREAMRQDAQKSREHGNKSAKDLADAIREHSAMMDWYQTMIQTNQEEMIVLQKKMLAKKDSK